MTNDIVDPDDLPDPIKQFREKVADRIRDDIGNLMPDAMLEQIVKQSIDDILNEPTGDRWHTQPWLKMTIRNAISERVKQEAQMQISQREAEIHKTMTEAIRDQLPELISMVLVTILKGQASSLEYAIQNTINNMRNY